MASSTGSSKPSCVTRPRSSFWRLLLACLALTGALGLSGCATLTDFENSQEYALDGVGSLAEGYPLGQTLVARRPGWNGITLWLRPADQPFPETAAVIVELLPAPQQAQPLASTRVAFTTLAGQYPVTIALPPQPGPPGRAFFLRLRAEGGVAWVYGRNEDAYPFGQAYQGDQPLQADLAFRLSYAYTAQTLLEDLVASLPGWGLALPLGILLLAPGWLALYGLGLHRGRDPALLAGLSLGVSLSFTPLLMLWTSQPGLDWSRPAVLAAGVILGLAAAWTLWRTGRETPPAEAPPPGLASRLGSPAVLLLGVFIFVLATRLVMTRDLSAPAWVDSVHHTLIARLIIEGGGLPASYAPYAQTEAFRYHAGFHSLLAAFHWLSGMELSQALLLLGQALNALSVPAVYLFTVALIPERRAGLFAAVIAGMFTPMPAYYTSWGRYTQLAGLLILPAALYCLRQLQADWTEPRLRLRWTILSAACLSGVFLIHYRVLAFLGCLWLALLLADAPMRRAETASTLRAALFSAAAAGIGFGIASAPWLWPTLTRLLLPRLAGGGGAADTILFADFAWRYLNAGLGSYTLALGAAGLLWLLLRRARLALAFVLWIGLMFLLANLGALGLPGRNLVNNTSVAISLFLPIAALGGSLLAALLEAGLERLPARGRLLLGSGAALAVLGLMIYGAGALLPILNPATILFRQADRQGLAWVQEHLPANSRLLVNPAAWGYNLYVGQDGGYWLSPLTGLQSAPPPLLYAFGDPQALRQITGLARQVIAQSQDPAALWQTLRDQGIEYIYIGARGGMLSPARLSQSGYFKVIYSSQGVWVLRAVAGPG
jgi:hypothetical protein